MGGVAWRGVFLVGVGDELPAGSETFREVDGFVAGDW